MYNVGRSPNLTEQEAITVLGLHNSYEVAGKDPQRLGVFLCGLATPGSVNRWGFLRYQKRGRQMTGVNKKCEHCGKQFEAKVSWQRFCSRECNLAWTKQNGTKNKRTTRKICEHCGREYEPSAITASRQRFCSKDCQRAWWLENREQEGKVYTFTCQNCGKEYETIYSNRDTCCSPECGWELQSKLALIEKRCLSCGTMFEEVRSGAGYCCSECQGRGRRLICSICGKPYYGRGASKYCDSEECQKRRQREWHWRYKESIGRIGGRLELLNCQYCGKEFRRRVWNKIPIFCSRRCQRQHYASSSAGKAQRAKSRMTRRARKYGNGLVEAINCQDVFERDGWLCGVCGKKVNPRLRHPHPMSASLDHIIPLAKGGPHTLGNVQLAHLRCNVHKGVADGGQLRLGFPAEESVGREGV